MSVIPQSTFLEATHWIKGWQRPLLVSHTKPDGDALGSLVAMRAYLRSTGVEPLAALFDPIPSRYRLFQAYDPMHVLARNASDSVLRGIDGVIILDTCTYSQLDSIADWLRARAVPVLAVDHHVSRENLADRYLIDESAAATCLMLYEWACATGWPVETPTADALFVGMAMDTGWFQHSNTDRRVLVAASDLVTLGVVPHDLYRRLHLCETPGRVRLLGEALRTLELLANERLAVMTLQPAAFSGCGATQADTEDIVNEPMRIGSVAVSVLLVDQGDGLIRASFRSKLPPTRLPAVARPDVVCGTQWSTSSHPETPSARQETAPMLVNVDQVARSFGGGGHTAAAGARIKGTLADVHRAIVDHFESKIF